MSVSRSADTGPVATGRRWFRFALISLFGVAVGAVAGWATLSATRPSENELQRAVLEEIGLPAELEASPILGPVIDHYTTRVTDRAVRESRGSATLAIALSVIVSAAATATTATLLHPSPSETHRRSRTLRRLPQPRVRAVSEVAEDQKCPPPTDLVRSDPSHRRDRR